MQTGRFIKLLRVIKGMTVVQLSESSGISRIALTTIEADKVSPRLSTVKAIANGLGLTEVRLFELYGNFEAFEVAVIEAMREAEGGGNE